MRCETSQNACKKSIFHIPRNGLVHLPILSPSTSKPPPLLRRIPNPFRDDLRAVLLERPAHKDISEKEDEQF